jgi:hypothetical protein
MDSWTESTAAGAGAYGLHKTKTVQSMTCSPDFIRSKGYFLI